MSYYYYKILRKTILGFLDIFNDIIVARYNKEGEILSHIKVPIKFGPKSKAYSFLLDKDKTEVMLPMISVSLTGIDFDSERMTNRHQDIRLKSSDSETSYVMAKNMVPYNFGFNLVLWAKNIVDIDQIVEQILPYFAPHGFITINIPELNIDLQIKVVFSSCSPQVTDDVSEEEARTLKWDIAFICQGYLFSKMFDSSSIIYKQNIRLFTNEDSWSLRDTESEIISGGEKVSDETIYLEGSIDEDAKKLIKYEIW